MRKKIFTFLLAIAVSAGTLIAQNSTNAVGVFSVSATQKVAFSPGNLQYNAAQGSHLCADGTTKPGTWRFAEHQWDYIGNSNSNISSTYDGWIDLFGWGTSGWNSGANEYQPYSTRNVGSDYRPGGSYKTNLTGAYAYADWGVYNQIGNDTPGTWRTLSKNEWYYLFYSRPNARHLFALGKVNGVPGVILLPDNWETPSGVSFVSSPDNGMYLTGNDYWKFYSDHYFSDDVYTLEQWEIMESAGAVFLPITGLRTNTSITYIANSYGYYWSTTHCDEVDQYNQPYDAYYIWFYSEFCDPHHYYTPASQGMAVRLVSNLFTITFVDADGNTIGTPQVLEYGQSATPPEPPTRDGYSFTGWIGQYQNVTGNAIIYASYEPINSSLVGVFSISQTETVQFSHGNLQYHATAGTHKCADGSTKQGVWRFAEHQYDMIGANNKNASSSYTGWIDLFCWGTSGWNSGATAYQPWSISKTTSDYLNQNLSGEYANADWGVYNAIVNGGNTPEKWRTLTYNEWNYLLSNRPNANDKKAVATVNGIEGIVLLPDNWTLPSGVTFTTGYGSSISLESYRGINDYTLAQWTIMENAGAIFLPNAGIKSGASYSRGAYECYQTSTNGAAETNSMVSCSGSGLGVNNLSKYKTNAVPIRLVQDVAKYTITFRNYDNSILSQQKWTEGSIPSYTGEIPTRPADAQYTYTFSGWDAEVVAVTGAATYTAQFSSTLNKYTIAFVNYDGTPLQSGEVEYGTIPTYTGETPTKPADAQYTYTFSGWDAEVVAVTGAATYTAQFTSTLNKYVIAFVNYDGTPLQSSEVEYGTTPAYTGETPIKPADVQYTYSFGGWDAEVVAVTGEATYTAQFTSTLNKYAISFVNYDGTPLQSGEVEYGTMPAYTGETPTKPADAQYTYTFSGWDAEVVAVTGEATYTAQFSSTLNKYAISFVNYDGTPLQSGEVEYGTIPAYTGATPTRPADAQYTYTFSGWDAEVVAVTGAATYTAQFSSTLNKYTIAFVNYDGTPLQSGEVEYGTIPAYTGATPIKPADAQYTYSFSGWDADLVAVTGEATYTAMFASLPIASSDSIFIHDGENPNLCDLGAQYFSHVIIEPGGELNINQSCIHVEAITIISTGVKSGQIHHGNNPIPTDRIFMEYVLNPVGENASPNLWYAFAVPFEVDIETGITRAYGNKNHVSGTDFLVKEFDGSLRATTGKGWKSKLTGTLDPGRFYVIGIDGNCNRWLFEKTSEAAFEGDNHMNIYYYSANNAKNNGWNGMGNTQLEYTTMDLSNLGIEYILTYNSRFDKYDIGLVSESSLCVGQPFIIQTPVDGEFDFIHSNPSSAMPALYADRQTLKPLMHFTLADETQSTGIDHMYLTMHDDATLAYTIGRDVTRMSATCTTAAQLWCTTEDGVQLSAHGIEMPDNSTTVNLELFAPAAGEYLLSMASRAMDGYEVELLYNGTWVAALDNEQPLTLTLNSGVNNGYALRITRHNVPTDIESITPSDAVNGEKRIIDGVLYILHNGRMYDAQGKQLKDN